MKISAFQRCQTTATFSLQVIHFVAATISAQTWVIPIFPCSRGHFRLLKNLTNPTTFSNSSVKDQHFSRPDVLYKKNQTVLNRRCGEVYAGVKLWKNRTTQQCPRFSFKTISTTHLAQRPLTTHNIKHRQFYLHIQKRGRKWNTDLCCTACRAVTLSSRQLDRLSHLFSK